MKILRTTTDTRILWRDGEAYPQIKQLFFGVFPVWRGVESWWGRNVNHPAPIHLNDYRVVFSRWPTSTRTPDEIIKVLKWQMENGEGIGPCSALGVTPIYRGDTYQSALK